MSQIVSVNYKDYQYACESYLGWCPACKDFTRETTEPDVSTDTLGYYCPICQSRVYGAEQALLEGKIDVDLENMYAE